MEFLTQLLAATSSMSSISVVILLSIVISSGIIVYFKYIKPAFIGFIDNQNIIRSTSVDVAKIKEATVENYAEDNESIREILSENSEQIVELASTVSHLRGLIEELSNEVQTHDHSHRDKLTDMLMELNKLSIRLENGMVYTRGIK